MGNIFKIFKKKLSYHAMPTVLGVFSMQITKKRFSFKTDHGEEYYYCLNCESEIGRGDNYCSNCGIRVIWNLK